MLIRDQGGVYGWEEALVILLLPVEHLAWGLGDLGRGILGAPKLTVTLVLGPQVGTGATH